MLGAFALLSVAACETKKKAAPQPAPYQVGSVFIALPPSVQVPYPQGRPDAPTVNASKCTFVVDRQITYMTKSQPELKPSVALLKPGLMQECQTKWTQEQYDCIVKAQSLEEIVLCKRFQRP